MTYSRQTPGRLNMAVGPDSTFYGSGTMTFDCSLGDWPICGRPGPHRPRYRGLMLDRRASGPAESTGGQFVLRRW
jgi:hypothetical protein